MLNIKIWLFKIANAKIVIRETIDVGMQASIIFLTAVVKLCNISCFFNEKNLCHLILPPLTRLNEWHPVLQFMHPSYFFIAQKFSTNFLSDSDTGETPHFKIKHIKPTENTEGTTKSGKKSQDA